MFTNLMLRNWILWASCLMCRTQYTERGGRALARRQNLNEYIGTLHLAPTQFCYLPVLHRKTFILKPGLESSLIQP